MKSVTNYIAFWIVIIADNGYFVSWNRYTCFASSLHASAPNPVIWNHFCTEQINHISLLQYIEFDFYTCPLSLKYEIWTKLHRCLVPFVFTSMSCLDDEKATNLYLSLFFLLMHYELELPQGQKSRMLSTNALENDILINSSK